MIISVEALAKGKADMAVCQSRGQGCIVTLMVSKTQLRK